MKKSSIKYQLLISIGLLIITILGVGSELLYIKVKKSFYEQIDASLERSAAMLSQEVEINDGELENEWLEDAQNHPQRKHKDYIQTWSDAGEEAVRSPDLGSYDLPFFHGEFNKCIYRDILLPQGQRGRAVGLLFEPPHEHSANMGGESNVYPQHVIVLAIDVEHNENRLVRLRWTSVFTVLGLTAAAFIIISLVIKRSLAPIEELTQQVSNAQPNDQAEAFQITPNFPIELKGLVVQYNTLLERIGRVRRRERDFSANAAHELRTPLAGISTTLELALSKQRDTAYYENSISSAMEISRSMHQLLERLMSFSRLQNESYQVVTESVQFQETLTNLWGEQDEKAKKRELTPQWDLKSTKDTIETDKLLLEVLIRNIFDNATSYAKQASSIGIETYDEDGRVHLRIFNETEGLKKSDTKKFFDPFYRQDDARVMNLNHYGIGLSLCWEIARVLDREILVHLDEDEVITFEFIFS